MLIHFVLTIFRRDAIIKSFSLAEQDFKVVASESESVLEYGGDKFKVVEITYQAVHPTHGGTLGFIKYTGENGQGIVEIMNARATLQPQHLHMGATAKAKDETQAGSHGDGLKVATLVLLRKPQNFAVECCTGGVQYAFDFSRGGRLEARLVRMTKFALKKADAEANKECKLTWLSSDYVHFFIGGEQEGLDQNGTKTTKKAVSEAEFRGWTKVALFLHDCSNKLTTKHGDLIWGPTSCRTLYLKGLELSSSTDAASASITGKPLKFGYNFVDGSTDRDRKSVKTAGQEAYAIAKIWDEAVRLDKSHVKSLHDLLSEDPEREHADVLGAYCLDAKTLQLLRTLLLEEAGDNLWYFPAYEEQNVSLFSPLEPL